MQTEVISEKKKKTKSTGIAAVIGGTLLILIPLVLMFKGYRTHTTDIKTLYWILIFNSIWLCILAAKISGMPEYRSPYFVFFPFVAGFASLFMFTHLSPAENISEKTMDMLAAENDAFLHNAETMLYFTIVFTFLLLVTGRKKFARFAVTVILLSVYLFAVALFINDGISVYIEKEQAGQARYSKILEGAEYLSGVSGIGYVD